MPGPWVCRARSTQAISNGEATPLSLALFSRQMHKSWEFLVYAMDSFPKIIQVLFGIRPEFFRNFSLMVKNMASSLRTRSLDDLKFHMLPGDICNPLHSGMGVLQETMGGMIYQPPAFANYLQQWMVNGFISSFITTKRRMAQMPRLNTHRCAGQKVEVAIAGPLIEK